MWFISVENSGHSDYFKKVNKDLFQLPIDVRHKENILFSVHGKDHVWSLLQQKTYW